MIDCDEKKSFIELLLTMCFDILFIKQFKKAVQVCSIGNKSNAIDKYTSKEWKMH